MGELKFLVRVPMDCWRQWIRHRTASVNEYSHPLLARDRRDAEHARRRSGGRRPRATARARDGYARPGRRRTRSRAPSSELQDLAREVYEERLEQGVAREQARKDLPLSTYTEAYWKIDLHNLLHFLALRMDAHAQLEIRRYAETIGHEIVARCLPAGLGGVPRLPDGGDLRLTRLDREVMELVTRGDAEGAVKKAEELGILSRGEKGLKRNRERSELESKLKQFGLSIPWADQD